jgi:hypothetical protein
LIEIRISAFITLWKQGFLQRSIVHDAVHDLYRNDIVGRRRGRTERESINMSKRLFWIFVTVSCLAAGVLFFVRSAGPVSSRPEADGRSIEATADSAEVPQPDAPPTEFSGASVAVKAPSEPQAPQSQKTPTAEPPTLPLRPKQSSAPLAERALAINQPEAVASQNAGRQAEVWSYPAAMQQNASNNFVRAMDKLAKANSDFERYSALGNAAKSEFVFGQFEDARSYASELLALDERFKSEASRDGQAVYDGNLILGRLAAQEGRMDEAKQYLLEAGTTTGSAVLGSFGPNMSLAKDLLQSGERDAVLEFFEYCRKFWSTGNDKLTLWSDDVRAGRMPDFGANLLY